MDQKSSWLWKKRSTEKTLIADKASSSLRKCEGDEVNEVEKILNEKTDLERELLILNEKLSCALSECNAKDNIVNKQVKIAEEAIAGWEKSENEARSLKQEIDKVLLQKTASEERIGQLDAAFKECMQQLRFVREEQEKRVHGAVIKTSHAVIKTSQEFEKIRISLNENLAEASKRLVKAEAENGQLSKALLVKEKVIEDLSKYKTQVDADFNALRLRLESTEKENASLKYEIRVLEKELDIRNEEREFDRRTADVAQKQHHESVKKIAKLETECQRLRALVCKRLPGPAALAKMKSEVKMLRKSNLSPTSSMEFCSDLEEEKRALKDASSEKSGETQFSKTRVASRLLQAEGQFEESFNGETDAERSTRLCFLQENTLSDLGSDDKASCAESWASALISELEHFKNEKQMKTPSHRNMRISDMNLMDDFAEMEMLAVVSADVVQTSPNKTVNLDSIQKIIELLEGINIQSRDKGVGEFFEDKLLSNKASENPTGYMVRVFQWKINELSAVLQRFVQTCNDLLNGMVDFEYFAQQVASCLEWVMNHCFSIQDASSMKDAIMSHLDWDESRSESEVDNGWANYNAEFKKMPIFRQDMSGNNNSCRMVALEPSVREEGKIWNVERVNKELSKIVEGETDDLIENLYAEKEIMKQSDGDIGNRSEKHRMMKEDLETRVMETDHEWRKACERISHLENELENKNNSCKRLEETCNELKYQLKSMASKEVSDNGKHPEKLLQNDWEITAASEKLAECQETIINLGKQLKALASPSDAALFDKVLSKPPDSAITSLSTPRKNTSHRSCLLDKMLAEDNHQLGGSIKTKKDSQNENDDFGVSTNGAMEIVSKFSSTNGVINHEDESKSEIVSMDIVPCKKNGGKSFFRKVFWRQNEGNRGKNTLLMGCN